MLIYLSQCLLVKIVMLTGVCLDKSFISNILKSSAVEFFAIHMLSKLFCKNHLTLKNYINKEENKRFISSNSGYF